MYLCRKNIEYTLCFFLVIINIERIIKNMKLNEIKVILTGGKDDREIQNGIQ